jgi:kynurenine formamidase
MTSPNGERARFSADEFAQLFQALSTWGHWGATDQRGALNLLTPERVAAAAELVQQGVAITLSWPLRTEAGPHTPQPAEHRMTTEGNAHASSGMVVEKDYVGIHYHGDTHTHLDALCHIGYEGLLYNGVSINVVTADGAGAESVELLKDGLVGRGLLLDIPAHRGVQWLEPGDSIFREDLEAAEEAQGTPVREGDILLIRTGHARRLDELGPWDTPKHKAGLHPTALTFVAERGVAVLGSDGNSDTAPGNTEGVEFPVHVLTLNAMGVWLLDYLRFEELITACQQAGRWEFLFVAAPLRITGGTGSPINPLAIL